MISLDPGCVVGSEYLHRLAGVCQRFAGAICVAEPGVFLAAVEALTARIPQPNTNADVLVTWALLGSVTTRGALTHHAQFHRSFGGTCAFQPPGAPPLETSEWEIIKQRIMQWAELQTGAFDRMHRWPAATAAAAALQRLPLRATHSSDLARSVGASCSTLERGFRAIYGTTPGHYHALVRLRYTVEAVRGDRASLEGIVLEAGWTSVNVFARAFRTLTGTKPSILRDLSEEDFACLMNDRLALPVPRRDCQHVQSSRGYEF